MSDIKLSSFNWNALKKSANSFIPMLNEVSAGEVTGFVNADLYRSGQAAGVPQLSQHIIGRAMNLIPVTHDTARRIIRAYAHLQTLVPSRPVLSDEHIVGAYLVIPSLSAHVVARDMDAAALHSMSGVSLGAVEHALAGGRVTGGIAHALHSAFRKKGSVPALEEFATSDPRLGNKALKGAVFKLEDLLLPLPTPVPDPWP